ncbi:TetR/AcrR family transcriptional regulator [Pedosphaera parvula]|uniref:Transcriptional regulator, TetR family n=1 Tax=Pedosphaera parvula (strain Ellin514) TaxID=320771 RepID=B9XBR2_PEDPL|nr:TetR/AcrR family transcriptional regulator [Pedosphaera parvula]EEF62947.1 transcriptional regulator, TetR family [Pedosphaera parvula Ellin514]
MQSGKPDIARCTPTQQRLLEAAARVYARDGLDGATTREIAREAGVNEVTLFRLFGSKEKLLAAVVGRTFDAEQSGTKPSLPQATGNLRKDLANYVRLYEALLTENLPLIRTLIGEIHRHRDQERKVADGIFRPLRTELINRLREAAANGQLRENVDPAVTVDLLGGMVFTGVLRRSTPNKPTEYTPADYQATCVEILARGIERVVDSQ